MICEVCEVRKIVAQLLVFFSRHSFGLWIPWKSKSSKSPIFFLKTFAFSFCSKHWDFYQHPKNTNKNIAKKLDGVWSLESVNFPEINKHGPFGPRDVRSFPGGDIP